jgi:hypothetical protein
MWIHREDPQEEGLRVKKELQSKTATVRGRGALQPFDWDE